MEVGDHSSVKAPPPDAKGCEVVSSCASTQTNTPTVIVVQISNVQKRREEADLWKMGPDHADQWKVNTTSIMQNCRCWSVEN